MTYSLSAGNTGGVLPLIAASSHCTCRRRCGCEHVEGDLAPGACTAVLPVLVGPFGAPHTI